MVVKREQETTISVTNFYRRDMAIRVLLLALVCIFSKVSVSAQQPPPQQQVHSQESTDFPDGPGKDAFLKTCSKCHSPSLVIANRQDREGWENTITKMVSLGAAGTDEDFTAILDYLVKNFPPQTKINVNKATAAALENSLSLPTKEAEAIVTYRDKNGDFKSLDDLKKVPEVDAKKLDAKKDSLTF
jgi:competence protein ComEA